MEQPTISLIFCTRNRAERLKACLDHLARIKSSHPWELVIVDNGSTDSTARILASFAASASFPVRLLYEARPGKSRGLNLGLEANQAEIIAFIDDDCYVAPDHIDRVYEIFADPKIGFAGGRVELFDPTDYPISIRTSVEREFLSPRSYVAPGWIWGANMMFRREVLEQISGFDPDLGPGTPFCGEDPDVQARASMAGWWGVYEPSIVVAHHHGRKANTAPALHKNYVRSWGSHLAKCLLLRETRSVYMGVFVRRAYWGLRRILAGRYGRAQLTDVWWRVEGFVGYLWYRLNKAAIRLGR